jgi:hypothetical protein
MSSLCPLFSKQYGHPGLITLGGTAALVRLKAHVVAGTSASGTVDIIINDTTGTFSIDYYVRYIGNHGPRLVGADSSVAHSITVVEIPTAVDETTWGVLKSRR